MTFTIQYANGCRIWDVSKRKLHEYILTSQHDVADVYEQATPVTKRVRKELAEAYAKGFPVNATPAARRFIAGVSSPA
jgi:hypothetical protein